MIDSDNLINFSKNDGEILTDEDIKSLFMGLFKLMKQKALYDAQESKKQNN